MREANALTFKPALYSETLRISVALRHVEHFNVTIRTRGITAS